MAQMGNGDCHETARQNALKPPPERNEDGQRLLDEMMALKHEASEALPALIFAVECSLKPGNIWVVAYQLENTAKPVGSWRYRANREGWDTFLEHCRWAR